MVKILTNAAKKGGSGKTTWTINAACELASRGYSVAVLDVDSMAQASAWRDRTDLFADNLIVQAVVPSRLQHTIDIIRGSDEIDVALIDTSAGVDNEKLVAARNADLITVPVRPSVLDLGSIRETFDLIEVAKGLGKAWAFINASTSRAETEEAIEALSSLNLRFSPIHFGHYAAFRRGLIDGYARTHDRRSPAVLQLKDYVDWLVSEAGITKKEGN